MLAPGPTSTTNASSAVAAMRTRIRRPAPTRAATTNTSPVTRAQFAPDTAVRWLSALAFIAASSSSETPDSSPIARPGSRAPPSPGVSWAARANAERTGSVHPSQAGASATTDAGCDAESRKLVDSPGSFARSAPETATTDPKEGTAADPSATVNTVTGTLIPRTADPAPAPSTPRAVPFQLHRSAPSNPDATRRPGLSARTFALEQGDAGSVYLGASGANPTVRELGEAAAAVAGIAGGVVAETVEETSERLGAGLTGALLLDQQSRGSKGRIDLGWEPNGPTLVDEIASGSYAPESVDAH